jgi:hypothetical protein
MTPAAAANTFEYQDGAEDYKARNEAPANRHGGGSGHKQDTVAD